MAKSKKTSRLDSLRAAQANFLKIQQEIKDFAEIEAMAKASGNAGIMEKIANTRKRYNEDFEYICGQRAYNLAKLIEETPMLFDKVLNSVLS